VEDVIGHFLPYYAAVMLTLYWATGGLIQPVLTDVSATRRASTSQPIRFAAKPLDARRIFQLHAHASFSRFG
jgi:hypothetical protein